MMGIREYDLKYIRNKYMQEAERHRFLQQISKKPKAKTSEAPLELCCQGLVTQIVEGIPQGLPDPYSRI